MKKIILPILLALLISGCATVPKDDCPANYVYGICEHCGGLLCVPTLSTQGTCLYCGKVMNYPTAINLYATADKQALKNADKKTREMLMAKVEYTKAKYSGTCSKCNRAFSFSQQAYDNLAKTPLVCPYCGQTITTYEELKMAMSRYAYDLAVASEQKRASAPTFFDNVVRFIGALPPAPAVAPSRTTNCNTSCDVQGRCSTQCY